MSVLADWAKIQPLLNDDEAVGAMDAKVAENKPVKPNFQDHTILIVDDTPANLETLYGYFESLGFEIMMAQNGPAALKRVEYIKPDIILLDVVMPGMDGFETCRQLKADDATKHIPVIFMTALTDTAHKVKGFQAGAADYITKPFQIEEVLARVQTHLALRDLQTQLEQQNVRLQAEIGERQATAAALQQANDELELRVERRTAELAQANASLAAEIMERQKAEQAAMLEERNRLARELHDSVTQLMYSINLFAKAGKDAYRLKNPAQGEKFLTRLEDTARQALKELRLLLFELRPPELEQAGLVGALQLRLDAVEGRAGVKTQLLVHAEAELPQTYEEALYAIAQEALNNALKHANAASVTIQLQTSPAQIKLVITDDGVGFDPQTTPHRGGMGLTTMHERAISLRGALHVHAVPNQGTSIQLTIPAPVAITEDAP